MKNTYQLSQSGIERLERFKRDIEAGDCDITVAAYYDSGAVMYYDISSDNGFTCCFDVDKCYVVDDAIEQIEATISGALMKKKSCFITHGGIPLERNDITTPAQRALEALGKKLRDRSAAWN